MYICIYIYIYTELGSATLKCSGATATATCLKKQRRYRYSYNFSNIAALPLQTNVARYNHRYFKLILSWGKIITTSFIYYKYDKPVAVKS